MYPLTPTIVIDRIIARGYEPVEFVSHAHRDRPQEWAVEFETLAYISFCLWTSMSPDKAIDYLDENLSFPLEQFIEVAIKTHWLRVNHREWLAKLAEIIFRGIYDVQNIDQSWGFTAKSNLSNMSNYSSTISCKLALGNYENLIF